jgi:hypothetical protein
MFAEVSVISIHGMEDDIKVTDQSGRDCQTKAGTKATKHGLSGSLLNGARREVKVYKEE